MFKAKNIINTKGNTIAVFNLLVLMCVAHFILHMLFVCIIPVGS